VTGTETALPWGASRDYFRAAKGAGMLFARVPLHFSESLPKNRAFTRLEAAFQYDMDRVMSKKRPKLEYSKMWSWDRGKVDRFIKEIDSETDTDSLSIPIKNGAQKRRKITTINTHIKQPEISKLQEQNRNITTISPQHVNTLFIEEREREQSLSLSSLWNEIVAGVLSTVRQPLSKEREKKSATRLKERPFEEWREIFRLMIATPFLCGSNDRGWKADFDWIIANDGNAAKVLEGKYTNSYDRPATSDTRYTTIFAGA
jgi:hypothetical protein